VPRVEQRGRELWILIPEDVAKALALEPGDALSFEMLDAQLAGLKKAHAVSDDEMAVLRKINEVRFSERTKERLRTVLTEGEQKILGRLVKRGAVQFYQEGKYKDTGVYSITKDYYSFLAVPEKKPGNIVHSVFGQKKYLVADDIERARELLTQLEEEVRNGDVVSVRGFDKKVYITTREAVESVGSKVVASLEKGELTLAAITKACNDDEGLVRAVLEILRESGDLIEKRRGVYALA